MQPAVQTALDVYLTKEVVMHLGPQHSMWLSRAMRRKASRPSIAGRTAVCLHICVAARQLQGLLAAAVQLRMTRRGCRLVFRSKDIDPTAPETFGHWNPSLYCCKPGTGGSAPATRKCMIGESDAYSM